MKSIIKGMVSKKEYFMGTKTSWRLDILVGFTQDPVMLSVTEESNRLGELQFKLLENVEEVTLVETLHFHKILDKNEYIKIDDELYKIIKVVNGADGTMYYYVNIEIEDEDSKEKTLEDIKSRELFVKGWEAACKNKDERIIQDTNQLDELTKKYFDLKSKMEANQKKFFKRGELKNAR